jgi:hypothetical protein
MIYFLNINYLSNNFKKTTMKKFQAMMAVVLVALMVFAVQSCGSDDKTDLSGDTYRMSTSMVFQDKGQLPADIAATLEKAFVASETGQYITDKSAADKTAELVKSYAAQMPAMMQGDKTVKFTVTVVTTNLRTNKEVCRWDIVYDKGSVSTKKY